MPDESGRFRLSIAVPELPWLKQEPLEGKAAVRSPSQPSNSNTAEVSRTEFHGDRFSWFPI